MAERTRARWRALGGLLRPDAWRWAGLGVLVATSAALTLAGPLVVRRIVDNAADGTDAASVARLAGLFLAIAIGAQLFAVVVAWFATVAAWRTTNSLRLTIARHVLELDHEFHRQHTPGELIQRTDGDVTSVSEFLGRVVPKALGALLLVLGIVGVLVALDWRLAIGMLVYLCLALTVIVRSRHRAVGESSEEMGALARLYGGIEERLTAGEDLRANGAAQHAAWRFIEESEGALTGAVRRERAFLVMWWFVQAAVVAGWAVALVGGVLMFNAGAITLGTAFLLFQYVLLVSRPLEEVVHELETVQKANGAMVRVLDLLEVRPTIVDSGTTTPMPGALAIEFTDVGFDYGDDQLVLRDVSIEVPAGTSIGVVGRTGSGKTTFSRLVLRLVEATAGTISIGSTPIGDVPLDELRRRVALVPQEVELFTGTVRDNVTLFDDEPTDDAVTDALERVGLDRLAGRAMHRQLGAGGGGLSAGESQLLSLARVWLRDPDLIVLDEATARVDPGTEQRIEQAVGELIAGRTAVIIAHRLSTLRAVDSIAVFSAGQIVEHGSRADLLGDDESRFTQLLELSQGVVTSGSRS
ncbi:MAG: ABC transporter ATP-binding protein [Actinomycetota bacterium]